MTLASLERALSFVSNQYEHAGPRTYFNSVVLATKEAIGWNNYLMDTVLSVSGPDGFIFTFGG